MSAFKAPAALIEELGILEPSDLAIEPIAQYCGATVVYAPLDGCAARIVGEGDRAIITVNSRASRPRQRYSAAHELGHWMRDRGRIAFSCKEQSFLREWGDDNAERRANRYAADILLPRKMFESAARGTPATFDGARELARAFETSLTSTAIRLVELGDAPAMLVCNSAAKREWFFRSSLVPDTLWPLTRPGSGSLARHILAGESVSGKAEMVDADDWIEHADAKHYSLVEHSIGPRDGLVLSFLWWRDEAQILALTEDEDGDPAQLDGHLPFRRRKGP